MSNKLDIIKIIKQNLSKEIDLLNNLTKEYYSSNASLTFEISDYLFAAGGKRIRPLLTIITSKIFEYEGDDNIKLAAAAEFIHNATLLHDDVVDESAIRRFKPTSNLIWGNKASILVGDFLLTQAFRLIISAKSIESMKVLSRASSMICEGEVTQLMKLKLRSIISEDEYFKIIRAKTSELFGACCSTGAIIAQQTNDISTIMYEFGIIIGNIFQIIDDLLDYLGTKESIGKNNGDDFFEGKVTLPLIILYNKSEINIKLQIDELLKLNTRSFDDFEYMKSLFLIHNVKDDIFNYLNKFKQDALSCLSKIQYNNIYVKYLSELVDFIITRSY
jgi:octaprenyl-diphosphate synthase